MRRVEGLARAVHMCFLQIEAMPTHEDRAKVAGMVSRMMNSLAEHFEELDDLRKNERMH